MSKKEYLCPRCGKPMLQNGKTPGGRTRWRCRGAEQRGRHCYSTTDPERDAPRKQDGTADEPAKNPQFKRALGGTRRLVVTAAQNATPVHAGFLKALEGYCERNGAELVVVPIRYKNPTSKWTESQANDETWDPRVHPYLYNQRKKLNKNLVLLGDVKVQPTATRPLTSFEGMTHGESCILAHTKLQLKTVASPSSKLPKLMTTTGAVTVPNYTDSKAGKLGEFHHTLGACAVDIKGKIFHLRQFRATSDGGFIDANENIEYLPDGTWRDAAPAQALVLGDFHWRSRDPKAVNAVFGPGGQIQVLDPQVVVLHDLLDGMSMNPHERGNPFAKLAVRSKDFHLVEKEVRDTIEGIAELLDGREAVIVPSNHDRFLTRWVTDTDWKSDVENAAFYLETAKAMVDSVVMTPQGPAVMDPFAHWVEKWGPSNLKALKLDVPYTVAGIALDMHGDLGPNGARGSINNLSRLGVKVMSGHGHAPAIEEGHDRVGTMSHLRLAYAKGPSAWLQTNGVILANGKQSLLNIINGNWRV